MDEDFVDFVRRRGEHHLRTAVLLTGCGIDWTPQIAPGLPGPGFGIGCGLSAVTGSRPGAGARTGTATGPRTRTASDTGDRLRADRVVPDAGDGHGRGVRRHAGRVLRRLSRALHRLDARRGAARLS
ncbi:hypothetical protein GCM10020218_081400 [Dactylosporangium vinaceum]